MTRPNDLARATLAAFEKMSNAYADGDWADTADLNRYRTTVRTGRAWATGPRAVVASVGGPDSRIWGYVAGDALDKASEDFPDTFDTGKIEQINRSTWMITW